MNRIATLDHKFVWHPFTQMQDWLREEPIVLVSGHGSILRDIHGREYLDANSSIWTNLHGHNHPSLNEALVRQLGKVAHTSHLGFASEPASLLAEQLVELGRYPAGDGSAELTKVFYSDDGSTAMEVALKLAFQYKARRSGRTGVFYSMDQSYHGDTVGAVSLGHIDLFHAAYNPLLFASEKVMSPYCYRCRFNKAEPARGDAREYRRCQFECVTEVEQTMSAARAEGRECLAFVFEPLMQGAAGMIAQPPGWLQRVAEIFRGYGALLIADEVMTGFGRTGSVFACEQEGIRPDLLSVAKGLAGGYLPMAATLVTQEIFDAFLGEYAEFKTFFHGHSFTGNQLGSSAALASLKLLLDPSQTKHRKLLEARFDEQLKSLWSLPWVGDLRRIGLVAGVELVRDWTTREPFRLEERAGLRVCQAMAQRGVLTRPIGNVIVIMPPYSTTLEQLDQMIAALHDGIEETLRPKL